MGEFGRTFSKQLALPLLAALAGAWLLPGCATLVPEAARQVRERAFPTKHNL